MSDEIVDGDRGHRADEQLEILEEEIEHWNTQINLVSRVNTRVRIRDLVLQCRSGWALTQEALAVDGWPATSYYIDLGTGGGFPGLVWVSERWRAMGRGSSMLVEPRDKRAWFLRRTARKMGLEGVVVLQARWGEAEAPETTRDGVEATLISMKALRIDDEEILRGMLASRQAEALPREVAIVRFLDPIQHEREWLEEKFVARGDQASRPWVQQGVATLGEGDPRLLLTRYLLP